MQANRNYTPDEFDLESNRAYANRIYPPMTGRAMVLELVTRASRNTRNSRVRIAVAACVGLLNFQSSMSAASASSESATAI